MNYSPVSGSLTYSVITTTISSPITINTTSINTTSNFIFAKTKYKIFDKEIEVNGDRHFNISLLATLINLHGVPFYLEMQKQMIFLPTEITNFLDKEVLSYYRDKKI